MFTGQRPSYLFTILFYLTLDFWTKVRYGAIFPSILPHIWEDAPELSLQVGYRSIERNMENLAH